MQAYREIIDGKRFGSIVNLPSELRDGEVEIIVLPVERNKKKKTKLSQNWAGALSDYRNQYTSLELKKKALEWRKKKDDRPIK
jgi:hypothetical protein